LAENTKPATKILKARRMTRAWGDQPPTLEVALRYAGLTELGLRAAVDSVERELILLALLATRGNITHAARQLHITRPTLYSLIKKHKVPATTLQVIHH
jgi:transcriptional regulator of acetoin/glycerol metabolism